MKRSDAYIMNGPAPTGKPWFKVLNAGGETEPAEISIYDQIGRDPWDNSGTGGKEFAEALKAIPAGRKVNVRINSPGGSVWDGLVIYNTLLARQGDVTCYVDGIALSAASFIACAGKELVMAKASMLMIHNPSSMAWGDSDDMQRMAAELKTHADVIAGIYASKTGKPAVDWLKAMDAESWYTADEAKEAGLCDTVAERPVPQNTFDLSGFKRVPETLLNHAPSKPAPANSGEANQNPMRDKILALLKARGVTNIPEKATDEQLLELLPAPAPTAAAVGNADEIANLRAELKRINDRAERERKDRIERAVDQCVVDCRIPANQRNEWVNRIVTDETLLGVIQNLPENRPGNDPVSAIEIKAESILDIERHVTKNLTGAPRTAFLRANMARLQPVLNTNTISTDLKRISILDAMMRAFVKILTPLRAFSTVHANVPLQGTDQVSVPYYDLETATSTDFDPTVGYTQGNTTTTDRLVTINKRKYQGLSWTSSEFRRQPYLNIEMLGVLKSQKLAFDIWNDILSQVNAATYANGAVVSPNSATFNTIAALKGQADGLQWPEMGRSAIWLSTVESKLLQDSSFAFAFALGQEALKEGKINRIAGFDTYSNPNFPANGGENLTGIAAFISALLVATAPIEPTQEVRSRLTAYDVVVDPQTGISFEYRRWGDPDKDTSRETVECNYGYAKGNENALIRLTSV